jgi:predicted ATPase
MGAKSLELRATMSLARLLAKQSRRDEARATLAEIYGWFTEGLDTRDLKDRQIAARRTSGLDGDAVRKVQLRQPRRCTVLHEVRDQSRESLLCL